MSWLARLKNQLPQGTQAAEPTKPGFVGFVAPILARMGKKAGSDAAPVNDVAPDPDGYCWPRSPAMNTAEIDRFTMRLARFTDRGLILDHAERLADSLVIRDRDGDDRRMCLECSHLKVHALPRCGNWTISAINQCEMPGNFVQVMQHCPGFAD